MGDSILPSIIKVMVSVTVLYLLVTSLIFGSPTRGQAVQETTRTHELMGLQLSKEQVQSGSIEGHINGDFLSTVGYVQGSFDGRPVTYIYLRYRAENGDIIDRLIPRDQVRLRDDLKPGEAATLEIHTTKTRKATYSDIQQDPSLCYEGNILKGAVNGFFNGIFKGDGGPRLAEQGDPLPAEACNRHADEAPEDWNLDSEELVVHVPKDAIIVTINPNMVPEGAKKG